MIFKMDRIKLFLKKIFTRNTKDEVKGIEVQQPELKQVETFIEQELQEFKHLVEEKVVEEKVVEEKVVEEKKLSVEQNLQQLTFEQALEQGILNSLQDQKFIQQLEKEKNLKRYISLRLLKRRNVYYIILYKDPITMYKLVSVMKKESFQKEGWYLDLNIVGLLELRISGLDIRSGVGGQICTADNLQEKEKYCVGRAVVTGVQFIGKSATILTHMVKLFKIGEVKCVSNFDEKFVYTLGEEVVEENFGRPGHGCIQGIHCFLRKEDTAQYILTGFTGIDCHKYPFLTEKFEEYDRCERKNINTIQEKERSRPPPMFEVSTLDEKRYQEIRALYSAAFKGKGLQQLLTIPKDV